MRRASRQLPPLVALAVQFALPATSHAADGRFCGDPVESGLSSAETQEEALTKAERWWTSRAGAIGEGYEHWEHARDRAMECSKESDGTFQCKAIGTPCLPPGTLPENVPKREI